MGGINGNVPSVRRGNVRRVTGAVTDAPLMPSLRLTVLRCFPLCRGGVVVLSALRSARVEIAHKNLRDALK